MWEPAGRSVGVGRDDLSAGDGAQRPERCLMGAVLEEPDRAVAHRDATTVGVAAAQPEHAGILRRVARHGAGVAVERPPKMGRTAGAGWAGPDPSRTSSSDRLPRDARCRRYSRMM